MISKHSCLIPSIFEYYNYWRFIRVKSFLKTMLRDSTSGSSALLSTLWESSKSSTSSRSTVRMSSSRWRSLIELTNLAVATQISRFLVSIWFVYGVKKNKLKDMTETKWQKVNRLACLKIRFYLENIKSILLWGKL